MDRLYTPWRLKYMVSQKPIDCPFCDYVGQEHEHDVANLILRRGERAFVILNRYPYNNGHLMVLPYEHASNLCDLDDDTQAEMMRWTTYCTRILELVYHPNGFNIGINIGSAAGAGLAAHLHMHIVPRWLGDTNYMPVVAGTRILPELLEDTYQRLHRMMDENPFS